MTILVSTLTLALVIAAYALFLGLRQPAQTRVVFAPFATNTTVAPVALNTTDACMRACHTPTCTVTTGSVRCTTCPPGRVLAGVNCVEDPACGQWPWCTTPEAIHAVEVHDALLVAARELPVLSGSLYPTTATANLTRSSNYTILSTLGAPGAIGLLNRYLSTPSASALPTSWLDDAGGWWRGSLAAYQSTLRYADYVTALKAALCSRTWALNATSGACVAPL